MKEAGVGMFTSQRRDEESFLDEECGQLCCRREGKTKRTSVRAA
jgi:hypothetical protein